MTDRPWRGDSVGVSRPAEELAELRAELPASLGSAGQARLAVREALAAWGLDSLAGDAELLASELVANAAEHGDGNPIRLALRREADQRGERGVVCEVTDSSPVVPQAGEAGPDSERGRGLTIVAALASSSGVRASAAGKTAWFTLASPGELDAREPTAEAEAEIGA